MGVWVFLVRQFRAAITRIIYIASTIETSKTLTSSHTLAPENALFQGSAPAWWVSCQKESNGLRTKSPAKKQSNNTPSHQSRNDLSSFCPPSRSLLFLLFSSFSSPFEVPVRFVSVRVLELLKPPVRRRESEAVRDRWGAWEI